MERQLYIHIAKRYGTTAGNLHNWLKMRAQTGQSLTPHPIAVLVPLFNLTVIKGTLPEPWDSRKLQLQNS